METQKSYYITTEKMSVGYDGKPLIEEVEIMLRKGEILTLLGPNGCRQIHDLKKYCKAAVTDRRNGAAGRRRYADTHRGRTVEKNGSGNDKTSAGGTDDL